MEKAVRVITDALARLRLGLFDAAGYSPRPSFVHRGLPRRLVNLLQALLNQGPMVPTEGSNLIPLGKRVATKGPHYWVRFRAISAMAREDSTPQA